MCGMVWILRKDGKPASRSVRKRYFKQKHRGSDGFGYVAIKDNKVVSVKRAQFEHEIMEHLAKETAPEILFHHRLPTSTPNVEEQAHPLLVEKSEIMGHSYLITHNGVIRNADVRKEAHEAMGIKYLTEIKPMFETLTKKLYYHGDAKFNDSEALAVDTALALEGKTQNIPSEGAAAVMGIRVDGDTVVDRFFYRNTGNPMKYHSDGMMTTLASMGRGSDVEPINVMQLGQDGEYRKHPINVWTPYLYQYPNYPSTTRVVDYRPESVAQGTLRLPPPERGTKLIVEGQERRFLYSMSSTQLWIEWERVAEAIKVLEEDIRVFDVSVNNLTASLDSKISGRKVLQGRLDRLTKYEQILSDELFSRQDAVSLPEID